MVKKIYWNWGKMSCGWYVVPSDRPVLLLRAATVKIEQNKILHSIQKYMLEDSRKLDTMRTENSMGQDSRKGRTSKEWSDYM